MSNRAGANLSPTLTKHTAPDGTEYELAILLCSDKNVFIEVQGNWAKDSDAGDTVRAQMAHMVDYLSFEIGAQDYVSGNTYLAQNDGSEVLENVVSEDQNGYLLKRNVLQLLPDMTDTNEPLYQVCRDTWYAMILNNEKLVKTADDVLVGEHRMRYLGYYIPELNALDLTNVNAQSFTIFTCKAATSDLDAAPTK